jgi:hypothetical protein
MIAHDYRAFRFKLGERPAQVVGADPQSPHLGNKLRHKPGFCRTAAKKIKQCLFDLRRTVSNLFALRISRTFHRTSNFANQAASRPQTLD